MKVITVHHWLDSYLNNLVRVSDLLTISSGTFSSHYYLGLDGRKPVLGVSDQVMLEPACSATETSLNSEISFVASFDLVLSNK